MFGRPSNLVRKYVLPYHQLSRGGIPGAERPPATIIGGLSVRDYTAGVLRLSLFTGHAVSKTGTHPRSVAGHACEAQTLCRGGVQTDKNAGHQVDHATEAVDALRPQPADHVYSTLDEVGRLLKASESPAREYPLFALVLHFQMVTLPMHKPVTKERMGALLTMFANDAR